MGGRNAFAKEAIAALNDKTEKEIEWQVLQPGMVDEVSKAVGMNAADKSVVIRYEFYRYLGRFDDDGFMDPMKEQFPVGDTLNEFVGDYLGEQIAGFNADQPLMAPVPEPETYAMMLAGLGMLGAATRRRRSAR
ncbi:MAG: PEP-CTERM sorting domain-containing protein [Rhodocyclaceae bacterium]|nr:PEP-CTERM sorting domain-containing protein [Rhodocyclaceae bacterium]